MTEYIKFPHYQQNQALRDIKDRNFPAGTIQFEFGNEGSQYRWNPSKSYFRIRLRYEVASNPPTQPSNSFGLAPAMFTCDGLWQSIYQDINGICVSEVQDYNAQIASLKNRMLPKSHLDSVQKSLNMSEISLSDRMNKISNDGSSTNEYEYYRNSIAGLQSSNGRFFRKLNRFAIAATGIITFSDGGGGANTLPTINEVFQVGDILEIKYSTADGGNPTKIKNFEVTRLIDATSLQVESVTASISLTNGAQDVAPVANNDSYVLLTRKVKIPQSNSIELIWRPCLGFWNLNVWLPSGNYKLRLNPNPRSEYMRYCIESLTDLEPANFGEDANTKYRVVVEQIQLYVYKGTASPLSEKNIELDYDETRMQSKALTTASLTQNVFVINKSAHSFTVAYQDNLASGNDTRYSPMKFKIRNDEEQAISRLYIQRGGHELPTPKSDPNINPNNGTQYIAQLYTENLMYSGQFFNQGGQETIDDYIRRGLYYHYKFEDGSGDERLAVSQQFNSALLNNGSFTSNPNVLLFDHYYRKCMIQVKNGRIDKVIASPVN
jgi:hypothetical protein